MQPCSECGGTTFEKIVAKAGEICNEAALQSLAAEGIVADTNLRFIYCTHCGRVKGHTLVIHKKRI
jgi:hypothetical protein